MMDHCSADNRIDAALAALRHTGKPRDILTAERMEAEGATDQAMRFMERRA